MAHVRRCAAASIPIDARSGRSQATASGDRLCHHPACVVVRRRRRRRAAARRRGPPRFPGSHPVAMPTCAGRLVAPPLAVLPVSVFPLAAADAPTPVGAVRDAPPEPRKTARRCCVPTPLAAADNQSALRRCGRRAVLAGVGGAGRQPDGPGGCRRQRTRHPYRHRAAPATDPAVSDGPTAANAGDVHKMAVCAARARLAASAAAPAVANHRRGASSSPAVHSRHPLRLRRHLPGWRHASMRAVRAAARSLRHRLSALALGDERCGSTACVEGGRGRRANQQLHPFAADAVIISATDRFFLAASDITSVGGESDTGRRAQCTGRTRERAEHPRVVPPERRGHLHGSATTKAASPQCVFRRHVTFSERMKGDSDPSGGGTCRCEKSVPVMELAVGLLM